MAIFTFFWERPRISEFDQFVMKCIKFLPPSFIGALTNAASIFAID